MKPIQLFDPASGHLYVPAVRRGVAGSPDHRPCRRADRARLSALRTTGSSSLWTVETHAHADHITSAGQLAEYAGARTAAPEGCGITTAAVQLKDGDTLPFGREPIRALHTPGHTRAACATCWRDHVFTGDTLLVNGCGRTDFQSGSAEAMYRSITQVLFALPDADDRVAGARLPGPDAHRPSAPRRRAIPRIAGKTLAEFIAIDGRAAPAAAESHGRSTAGQPVSSGIQHDAGGGERCSKRVPRPVTPATCRRNSRTSGGARARLC